MRYPINSTARSQTRRKFRLALAAIAVAAIWTGPAVAEWSLTLPAMAPCDSANRPELPARWRAVSVMMPLYEDQVDVGELVYDGSIPAMRASVYGLESGAADILITKEETYILTGPHRAPTDCRPLNRKLPLPSNQWLSNKAVCVGNTQLAKRPVQLWKTHGAGELATWQWFNARSRLPWRSLFLSRTPDPAIIGDYSMTYFPAFTPLPETNLSQLRDLCRAKPQQDRIKLTAAMPTARNLMSVPNDAATAERLSRIEKLVPGLSHRACSGMKSVRWPDRYIMTAAITPTQFEDNPYRTLIYYDWSGAKTQLAIMMQGRPPAAKAVVSMKDGIGYRILLTKPKRATCEAVFPGIVRPDWMTVARCQCRGVIDRNPSLSPNGETQILSCPIKWQPRHVMWTWYTAAKVPVIFMEAAAKAGVMLVDYHSWLPGKTGAAKDFKLPNFCKPPDGSSLPQAGDRRHTLSNPSCSDCHTTR